MLAFSGPDALPTPEGLRRLGIAVGTSARAKQHDDAGDKHDDAGGKLQHANDEQAGAGGGGGVGDGGGGGGGGGARTAAFLYDAFPAPRAHFRVSMDIFLYRPHLLRPGPNGTWAHATELCLRATNRIPETVLAEVRLCTVRAPLLPPTISSLP